MGLWLRVMRMVHFFPCAFFRFLFTCWFGPSAGAMVLMREQVNGPNSSSLLAAVCISRMLSWASSFQGWTRPVTKSSSTTGGHPSPVKVQNIFLFAHHPNLFLLVRFATAAGRIKDNFWFSRFLFPNDLYFYFIKRPTARKRKQIPDEKKTMSLIVHYKEADGCCCQLQSCESLS